MLLDVFRCKGRIILGLRGAAATPLSRATTSDGRALAVVNEWRVTLTPVRSALGGMISRLRQPELGVRKCLRVDLQ